MRPAGWLLLLLHCAAACGCLMVLSAHYGLGRPGSGGFAALFFYGAAPWLLPLTSLIAWRKARQWRRMQAARIGTPSLARGQIAPVLPDHRPSLLERMSVLSLNLGVITLIHRAGWGDPFTMTAILAALWLIRTFARAAIPAR